MALEKDEVYVIKKKDGGFARTLYGSTRASRCKKDVSGWVRPERGEMLIIARLVPIIAKTPPKAARK